jgi:hypothetical protein
MLVVTRCHWYVNVGVGTPVHVPLVVVSVCPKVAVPVTAGATVLTGALPATEAVEFELAETPEGATELVAVTTQRIVLA